MVDHQPKYEARGQNLQAGWLKADTWPNTRADDQTRKVGLTFTIPEHMHVMEVLSTSEGIKLSVLRCYQPWEGGHPGYTICFHACI